MFCPKCAGELTRRNGELTCTAGEMPLSQYLERRLAERYGSQESARQNSVASIESNRWYCPGCGVLLDRELTCPVCHQSLRDLEHCLVELHPHR